jgi:hypothetical protein
VGLRARGSTCPAALATVVELDRPPAREERLGRRRVELGVRLVRHMRTRAAERGLHLRLLCREIALPAHPSVPPSHTGISCQSGSRVWHRPGPGRVGGKDHRTRVRVPCGASSDRRAHPDPGNRTDRHAPRGPIGTPHRASCCRKPHTDKPWTDKPRTEKPHTPRSIDSSTACRGLGPAAASAACPGQDGAPVHPCASSRAARSSIVGLPGPLSPFPSRAGPPSNKCSKQPRRSPRPACRFDSCREHRDRPRPRSPATPARCRQGASRKS